jgi:hypothetical protein
MFALKPACSKWRVRGERLRQGVPLHDHEGKAIRQAPVLVGADRYNPIAALPNTGWNGTTSKRRSGVNSTIAFRRDCPRARVRETTGGITSFLCLRRALPAESLLERH